MTRTLRNAGFPARFLMLARETFEVSVAIHYRAPWACTPRCGLKQLNDACPV